MKSGPPAGVNGTTSRIGWSGQACDDDDRTVTAAALAVYVRMRRRRIRFLKRFSLRRVVLG